MENSYIDYNHKSIQMKNITKKFGDFVGVIFRSRLRIRLCSWPL